MNAGDFDPDTVSRRKALLSSRAELERAQMALAIHDIREVVAPRRSTEPRRRRRSAAFATALVGIGVPLLGARRLGKMLKAMSLLLTTWKIVRELRRGPT